MAIVFLAVALCSFVFGLSQAAGDFNITCPPAPAANPSLIQIRDGLVNCSYYLAMEPNKDDPRFLDIYLEGTQKGWVAVGFSYDKKMSYTDVLGCKQDNKSHVGVINSWNDKKPPNVVDPTQDGVCTHHANYTDGKFSCLFSRYEGVINENYDYPLNDSFYLLLGCSETQYNVTGHFPYHQPNDPVPMDIMINPFMDTVNYTDKKPSPTPPKFNIACPPKPAANPSQIQVRDGLVNCSYYLAMEPNKDDPRFLDIYLEGTQKGWVAVGFSYDKKMSYTDVLGCKQDNESHVGVVNAWNGEHPPNIVDPTQDGVCTHHANYTDGKFSCLFSRYEGVINENYDYALNDSFYLLLGCSETQYNVTGNFPFHQPNNPVPTDITVNAFMDTVNYTDNKPTPTPHKFDIPCPPKPKSNPSRIFTQTNVANKCQYYLSMEPNSDDDRFIDIYLEGSEAGWVAVGFSDDKKMANSDVLGCKQDTSGSVGVVNTWNNDSPANVIDPSQDGLCPHSATYTDGKFSCLLSRYHGIINEGYDFDLNNSFHLLMGCGLKKTPLTQNLAKHDYKPEISDMKINPYNSTYNGSIPHSMSTFERTLLKTHGILMVIAYPLLLVTGVFFASWFKPVLPKGWFIIHIILNCSSLAIALLSFILVFVANKDNNPIPGIINLHDCGTKTMHFVFGILIILLHIINPIIAIFRCKPHAKNRWIFNLAHGTSIGYAIEVLALINICFGAAIFQSNCSTPTSENIMLWLFFIWIMFFIALQLFLYVYFTAAYLQGDTDAAPSLIKTVFKIKNISSGYSQINTGDDDDSNKTTNLKDKIVRNGAFTVYMLSLLIVVFVLIIEIAVDDWK